MTLTSLWLALGSLAALAGPGACAGEKPFVEGAFAAGSGRHDLYRAGLAKWPEGHTTIEGKLVAPVALNLKDVPLSRVVEDLYSLSGISMVLDKDALAEEGIDLSQPLSIRVENMTLKAALRHMLRQAGMDYVIRDECVVITTERTARGTLRQVIYAVADLVLPIGDEIYPIPDAFPDGQLPKVARGTTCEDRLLRLITSTIEPASWSENGGRGTIQYFPLGLALVVNQTPDVHEQIQDLLAALQRMIDDMEYAAEMRIVELRPDCSQNCIQCPKVTFFRGQTVTVNVGDELPVAGCSLRAFWSWHHGSSAGDSIDPIKTGLSVRFKLTLIDKDLRLDMSLETHELEEARKDGLVVAGSCYRFLQRVQPDKLVKLVMQRNEDGIPQRWVEVTLRKVQAERTQEQVYLGNLPPIPRPRP